MLILGVSYRGDVKETAFSGAFGVREELARRGAVALATDPLYSDDELRAHGFEPWDGGAVDAAVIQADHAAYARLTPADVPGARVVIDGRGVLDAPAWERAGVHVRRIGVGSECPATLDRPAALLEASPLHDLLGDRERGGGGGGGGIADPQDRSIAQ